MNADTVYAIDHASGNLTYEPTQAQRDAVQRVADAGRTYRDLRENVERVISLEPRMLAMIRESPSLNDRFAHILDKFRQCFDHYQTFLRTGIEELPSTFSAVMEFCDQFSRKVGSKGCLQDRLDALSNEDGGDIAVAREASLYIVRQLAERSFDAKHRCARLLELWTRFQEDSKAEAYSITGREGTSKMRDEIQLFTDRRNDAERQANALEREAQNNPIGVNPLDDTRERIKELRQQSNDCHRRCIELQELLHTFEQCAQVTQQVGEAMDRVRSGTHVIVEVVQKLSADLNAMQGRLGSIAEQVREEEPVLRSLARVDLESASELWFGLRAVANGVFH